MLTPNGLKAKNIEGAKRVQDYKISGRMVPVYEVESFHGLNQLIGYAKYINKDYGDVFYRGQNELFSSLMPALLRPPKRKSKKKDDQKDQKDKDIQASLNRIHRLGSFIGRVISSPDLANDLKLDIENDPYARYKAEGILQHYGVPTKCIDLVDNHWVALWMGLYKYEEQKKIATYYHYQKREISLISHLLSKEYSEEDFYQYILLLAFPYATDYSGGVAESESVVVIDLRKALPSVFLRPHAQHGLVALRKVNQAKSINEYDMAPYVIGAIRIRIDYASQWLGDGVLLSQENLFPPASKDKGYDQLLACQDLFRPPFELTKYI